MSSDRIRHLYPHVGFVLVYILWGINLTSMKIGGREWDPLVFNGLRFASMIPILWVYTYSIPYRFISVSGERAF